jgi:nicotinamide-nucleotide amidase
MRAAVLCTGTELTRGELVNTNATWLAAELTQLDYCVTAIHTIDDNLERIAEALNSLAAHHDIVVCTGGLGPTTDDVTAEAAALASGMQLQTDEPSLDAIRARLANFGRALSPSQAKQASIPAGYRVIANHHGTAPGFAGRLKRAVAYFLPGVPAEMKPMFLDGVVPDLIGSIRSAQVQIVLRTFGMAEGAVNDALSGIAEQFGVTLGYRAHLPELSVKVQTFGQTRDDASGRAGRAAAEIRRRLGERVVFSDTDTPLPAVVAKLMRERGLTFGVAESCTGGLTSALATEQPGVSDVFVGAVVAYDNRVKESVLGVPAEALSCHGAVSEPVARAMAQGARRVLGCDWALAITGIAGPAGATVDKPVGTVHFAVATPHEVRHHVQVVRGDRLRVQRVSAFVGLNWVRCLLGDPDADPV